MSNCLDKIEHTINQVESVDKYEDSIIILNENSHTWTDVFGKNNNI